MAVDFDARGKDSDRDTLKYTWDFGDGHKSYKKETSQHKEKGDYLFLPVIGAIVVAVISVILVGSAITTEKELRLSAPCLRMQEAGLHECPQICPEQSIEQSTETVSGWE